MRSLAIFGAIITAIGIVGVGMTSANDTPSFQPPDAVAVYESGIGLARRSITAPSDQTAMTISGLRPPVNGTFWLGSDRMIKQAKVRKGTALGPAKQVSTLQELLLANIGNAATIRLAGEDAISISGTLRRVASNFDESFFEYGAGNQDLLFLETENGAMEALSSFNISSAQFPDEMNTEVRLPQLAGDMDLTFSDRKAGSVSVVGAYTGLGWDASYLLDATTPARARLTLKAVVTNDWAPLEATDITLVAGQPNISQQGVMSALFPYSREGQGGAQPHYQMKEASFAVRSAPVMMDTVAMVQPGEQSGEMVSYKQSDVTLGVGERGYLTLFSEQIEVEPFYDVTVAQGYQRPNQEPQDVPVWWALRLENTTDLPWTKGPVMVMENDVMQGQSMLRPTAVEEESVIKVAQSSQVVAVASEEETNRVPNAQRVNNRPYAKVTIKGSISVRNPSQERIATSVSRNSIDGEVTDVSSNGSTQVIPQMYRPLNPSSNIVWNMNLAPGQEVELTYTYTRLQ